MKRLELKLIFIVIIGLIIGKFAPEGIKIIFKTITYNFFAFLSLFGGLMMFSSLAPGMKCYFEKNSRDKKKFFLNVLLSTFLVIILFILFRYDNIQIFSMEKVNLYFKLKVTPLMNFTTSILLSAIIGYVTFMGDGNLDGLLSDFKKGIAKIVEKFIFPAFFISIPGIVMDLQIKKLFVIIFLNRSWGEIIILLLICVKIFYFSKKTHGEGRNYSRLLYMNLFILVVACPLFRGGIVNQSIIYFMVYAFFLSFVVLLVEDIPAIVLLGFFSEIGGVSIKLLGVLIILYFIFSPLEKIFRREIENRKSLLYLFT